MATCKDCLHVDVCEWSYLPPTAEQCVDFKDKAKYVVREKGEWILGVVKPGYATPGGNRPWICPKCGSVISWHLDKPTKNFCPQCGADMRKEN